MDDCDLFSKMAKDVKVNEDCPKRTESVIFFTPCMKTVPDQLYLPFNESPWKTAKEPEMMNSYCRGKPTSRCHVLGYIKDDAGELERQITCRPDKHSENYSTYFGPSNPSQRFSCSSHIVLLLINISKRRAH